ncbi:MAG TPA: methyltransferase domain-containing protein [Acidimicrobiales bacterium]|nr:methyltransferase domain-containing protein [Acidimicrobiales bacterium]
MTFALSRTLRESDLEDSAVRALITDICGDDPAHATHRKSWEFAIGVLALEAGGVIHDDAVGLSVASGHEAILYYLANRCGRIFATDLYGDSAFRAGEGSAVMLSDPDVYAPYPYRRGRLHVSWMDALDLRFEDDAFDFVVSFGSIEHFGEVAGAAAALAEMARVVRPGGVVFVTTEQCVDGRTSPTLPGTWLFGPDELMALVADVPTLELLGPTDFLRWPAPGPRLVDIPMLPALATSGYDVRPHLGLRTGPGLRDRALTSVSLALRKRAE